MFFLSYGKAGESVSVFGDDDDVNWGCGCDITKCEHVLIFVDNVDW